MSDDSVSQIMLRLGEIQGEMNAGFEGVHARQDRTNGRIGKAEDRIKAIEDLHTEQKGMFSVFGGAWNGLSKLGAVVGGIALLGGAISIIGDLLTRK